MYVCFMDKLEIKRFTTEEQELAKLCFKIRTLVFVKEQGVDPDIEYDIYENQCTHYLLSIDDTPVGAARWRKTDKGFKLERFAILNEYRNAGLGDRFVKHVLADVLNRNQPIYLHSQEKSVSLYKRNGFEIVGNLFVEAGINHYLMEYTGKT